MIAVFKLEEAWVGSRIKEACLAFPLSGARLSRPPNEVAGEAGGRGPAWLLKAGHVYICISLSHLFAP